MKLNAILEHPSNSPSTKLLEFSSRLQEVDKGILKNYREPNWVMFKKAALFLLGITVVGAIVGLIDYALRGHHSIFCATKSHGERFILDVEEYVPKTICVPDKKPLNQYVPVCEPNEMVPMPGF